LFFTLNSIEECAEISKKFARLLSEELNVPVYLYAESQPQEYRKELPNIRQGEYEALKDRINDPKWTPDFGPAEFVPKYGASCVGARHFLIAYNINVLGTKEQAHRIALNVREQGRSDNEVCFS
jgi:glutamate formiminotransferase/formiminotetrahydrofolate cyclodeaminase